MRLTSLLCPAASTSPSPSGITPGLRLPRHQPLYSWQVTQSRPTTSKTTTNNSSLSSRNPSTTRRRSPLARPGTLTRIKLPGSPTRPVRGLSPSTPTRFPSFSRPSSYSQTTQSRKRPKLTNIPNAPSTTNLETPLPDAPRNPPPALTVRCIILARRIDVKTPLAPRAVIPRPSPAAAPSSPQLPKLW